MVGSPRLLDAVDAFGEDSITFNDLPFHVVSNASDLLAAIAALNADAGGTIYGRAGDYLMPPGAGPTISKRMNIVGPGDQVAVIAFDNPTAHDQAAFKFDNAGVGGNPLGQCSFSGFGFRSSDTTFRKFMIEAVDVQQLVIEHIASAGGAWSDASFLSEGVRLRGRANIWWHSSVVYTDIPLHIMADPRAPTLSADHSRFGPILEIASTNGNPVIKCDVGAVFSNTVFDGMAWVGGGFKWAGTSGTSSNNLAFRHIRAEQQSAGDWIIDISGTTGLQELLIDDVRGGSGTSKGIRLRTCKYPSIRGFRYAGGSTALDIDGSVFNFSSRGCVWGNVADGASATIAGQTLVYAGSLLEETGPLPSGDLDYQPSSFQGDFHAIRSLGRKMAVYTSENPGALANNGQLNIGAAGFSGAGTESVLRIVVSAVMQTSFQPIDGSVTIAYGGAIHGVSGSADTLFAYGNAPGKLSILWQNNSNIILYNQTGEAVKYIVEMTWY